MISLANLGQTDQENQTFTLADGRILGFAEYGDLKGTPLMYFHGTESCRYEGCVRVLGRGKGERVAASSKNSISPKREAPAQFWRSTPREKWRKAGQNCTDAQSKTQISHCLPPNPNAPRYEAVAYHEVGLKLKVRIISLDRPSVGLSTEHKNRTLLDWPKDVCALADHLDVARFSVVGISGGAPHALACAHVNPIKGDHPWGFDLRALSPAIRYSIWVGGYDDSYLFGKEMAEQIPNCELFEFPELGHLSTPANNVEAIVKCLAN